jgi:predicted AAA+ superfamily ATPase
MKIISIEKLRHELHQEYLKQDAIVKFKTILNTIEYWKEFGAFTCVSPRQSGKTTVLIQIAEELFRQEQQVIIFVPTFSMRDLIQKQFPHQTNVAIYTNGQELPHFSFSQYHLFVDEFMQIGQGKLDYLLNYNWKSVSLFGSLR